MTKPAIRRLLVVAGLPGGNAKEELGLGDLVRVIAMLPSFQAERIDWCSADTFHALVMDCRAINALVPVDTLDVVAGSYDVVLNLSGATLAHGNVIGVDDLTAGGVPLKQATFDLPRLIGDHFSIKAEVCFPVVEDDSVKDIGVGLNWRVPDAWAIKALPEPLWHRLSADLGEAQWQPEGGDLHSYMAWIRRCRLLISPVGLGCHLAMYFGVPLVMLAGPTDFAEAHDYKRGRVLLPSSECGHRPCYRQSGVEDCGGCMQYHSVAAILAAVSELRQRHGG